MKKIGIFILYLSGFILALCSILSVLRNVNLRYLKMLDFPRIQMFWSVIIAMILLILAIKKWKWFNWVLLLLLCIGLFINATYIINYTTLVNVKVPWSENADNSNSTVSILISNVKMTNKKSQPLLELISKQNPDIVLAMEVNAWWDDQLKPLSEIYPYSQHTINEVTYGMVLYSKIPLQNVKVDYLNNKNVPSFQTTLVLTNGQQISLHTIHPVPPTYFKELPDNEGQKATALQKLGKEVKGRKFPTIVAGDLNDVVWANVDILTETNNILYDVREGRGFYNSYNADNILMRWPLDHIFVTEEFSVKRFERLSNIGSDHFPLFVELEIKN